MFATPKYTSVSFNPNLKPANDFLQSNGNRVHPRDLFH